MVNYEIEREASLRAYEIYGAEENQVISYGVSENMQRVNLLKFLIPDSLLWKLGEMGKLDKYIPRKE